MGIFQRIPIRCHNHLLFFTSFSWHSFLNLYVLLMPPHHLISPQIPLFIIQWNRSTSGNARSVMTSHPGRRLYSPWPLNYTWYPWPSPPFPYCLLLPLVNAYSPHSLFHLLNTLALLRPYRLASLFPSYHHLPPSSFQMDHSLRLKLWTLAFHSLLSFLDEIPF